MPRAPTTRPTTPIVSTSTPAIEVSTPQTRVAPAATRTRPIGSATETLYPLGISSSSGSVTRRSTLFQDFLKNASSTRRGLTDREYLGRNAFRARNALVAGDRFRRHCRRDGRGRRDR